MSLPAFVLSIVIASFYAGLFHVLWGKKAKDLPYYWLAALLGFFAGSLLGFLVPLSFLIIGEVHLLEGSIVAAAALFFTRWLRAAQAQV